MMRSIAVVAMVSALVLPSVAGAQEPARHNVPFVKVAASKSSELIPDTASIFLGVVTERKTASEAVAENARTSQGLIELIKRLGVEPRDIRTVAVTVSPSYDEEKDQTGRVIKRTLRGYGARNSLQVRIRQVGKTGEIARQLIDKGANFFGGVQFDISDAEQRQDELRIQALQDAARKAKSYADALGLKLGRVLEIEPTYYPDGGAAADAPVRMRGADAPAVVIPVEPGVKTIQATVNVVWALEQ